MRVSEKERLLQTFNRHVEDQRAMFAGYGADKGIESLSTLVGELQEIGLDVSLDLHSTIAGEAFDLVTRISEKTAMRLITTGVLSIMGEERLVALSVSEQNKDTLNFSISAGQVSAMSGRAGSRLPSSARMSVSSIETILGWPCREGCNCPCPTSIANTTLAPLASRTSVKPPVEAPTSRQT